DARPRSIIAGTRGCAGSVGARNDGIHEGFRHSSSDGWTTVFASAGDEVAIVTSTSRVGFIWRHLHEQTCCRNRPAKPGGLRPSILFDRYSLTECRDAI